MAKHPIIAAIEIGTAKTLALVAEIIENRSLNIIGMGQARSRGIKKGEILDFKAASEATHEALRLAEASAKVQAEGVYLAQTGSHLRGYLNPGIVNVSSSNNIVSKLDVKRVEENAKNKRLSTDQVYIHHIRQPYKLDGRIVQDPYLMEGERLEVSYWSIHGDLKKIRDAIHIVNGFGLKVEGVVASSIAAAALLAQETEKKHGVLVLDMGCGTTDYALYKEGYMVRTGVLPVGGDHLTNDLSLGLRISLEHAEKMKQAWGKAYVDARTQDECVTLLDKQGKEEKKVLRGSIYKILNARLEELFKLIFKALGSWAHPQELPAGIILTGGTARLEGLDILLKERFGMESRVASNPGRTVSSLKGPEYSTALGVLQYALTEASKDLSSKETGLLNKVAKLFA